jgi:hypothetical protein
MTLRLDPIEVAADLYVTELVLAHHPHNDQVRCHQEQLITKALFEILPYTHRVLAEELGRLPHLGRWHDEPMRRWRRLYLKTEHHALRWAERQFHKAPEPLGGLPWATVAQLLFLHQTGQITNKVLLDQLLSWEHHTGCFFSHAEWENHRMGRGRVGELEPTGSGMRPVLDAHGGEKPDLELLLRCASWQTTQLCLPYLYPKENL